MRHDTPNRRNSRPPARAGGFTLVEALVSLGILLVIMTAVGKLFVVSGDAVGKSTTNNLAMSYLQVVAGQVQQDIQARPPDSFMGVMFQYGGPGATKADQDPSEYVYARTDRIVFYTTGDHSSTNRDLFVVQNNSAGASNKVLSSYGLPGAIRGGVARVFYGQSIYYDPDTTDPDARTIGKLEDATGLYSSRNLARRTIVLAPPSMLVMKATNPSFKYLLNPLVDAVEPGADESYAGYEAQTRLLTRFDAFDYAFQPLAFFESAPAKQGNDFTPHTVQQMYALVNNPNPTLADYMSYQQDFLSENPSAVLSWMRRPTIDAQQTVTIRPSDSSVPEIQMPMGLHMLLASGVVEFKVQLWLEYDDPDFLSFKDLERSSTPKNKVFIPSGDMPGTLEGTSRFPRWWPEEDFEKDDAVGASGGDVLVGERLPNGTFQRADKIAFASDTDFPQGLIDVRDTPTSTGTKETLHMQMGVFFGGPVDTTALVNDSTKGVAYWDPVVKQDLGMHSGCYYGSRKLPRAIRITVRMADATGRRGALESQSIVIPLTSQ